MAIGSRDPVGRWSIIRSCRDGIGSCRVGVLHLVVFDCRSSIAILSRRQHVLRYVHASTDCRLIFEGPLRVFEGGYRGGVDGNVFLLHRYERLAGPAERVEKGKQVPYGRAIDCAHGIKAVLILLPENNGSNTEFFLSNGIIINISSIPVL